VWSNCSSLELRGELIYSLNSTGGGRDGKMQLEDFNPGSQKNEKSDFFGERELQSNPGSDGFLNGDLVVRVQPIMASANLVYFSFVIFFFGF